MNTTPIANSISAQLATVLGDPVGGDDVGIQAQTNGDVFQFLDRNKYVCGALKDVINVLVAQYGDKSWDFLQPFAKTQEMTITAGKCSINKDFMYPQSLMINDTQEAKLVSRLADLKQDLDPYLDAGYSIDAGELSLYMRVTGVWADAPDAEGLFDYFSAGRVDPISGLDCLPNEGTDLKPIPLLFNSVVYFAAARACADKADSPTDADASFRPMGETFYKRAIESLPKPQ